MVCNTLLRLRTVLLGLGTVLLCLALGLGSNSAFVVNIRPYPYAVADTGGGQRGLLTPPPEILSKQDRDTLIEQSL